MIKQAILSALVGAATASVMWAAVTWNRSVDHFRVVNGAASNVRLDYAQALGGGESFSDVETIECFPTYLVIRRKTGEGMVVFPASAQRIAWAK